MYDKNNVSLNLKYRSLQQKLKQMNDIFHSSASVCCISCVEK